MLPLDTLLAPTQTGAPSRPLLLWGIGRMAEAAIGELDPASLAGVIHNLPGDRPSTWHGLPVLTADDALTSGRERPFVLVASMFSEQIAPELERRGYRRSADWQALDEVPAFATVAGPASFGLREPLPEPEVQTRLTGTSGLLSLVHGHNQYAIMSRLAERAGMPASRATSILDFGCGYARISRFFQRDAPGARIIGVDVSESLITWCRDHLSFGDWHIVPELPPTTLGDGICDLIVSFSVFTHLSEASQALWLRELHRWLRPGGVAVVTVWTHPATSRGYHEPHFPDYDALTRDFDAGRFCYSNRLYGTGATYGEALVPRSYADAHWTQLFDIVEWYEGDPLSPSQTHVALRKR